jgi:hypothetical protein
MINPMANGIITEKRTRFVCSSSDQQLPQIKSDSIVYRMCNNQERIDCQETGKLYFKFSNKKTTPFFSVLDSLDSLHFDNWSPWSIWSGKNY